MAGVFRKNSEHVYQAVPLLELGWLEHGFGSSFSTAWNRQAGLATVSQIHSDICLHAAGQTGRVGEGDALVTEAAGVRLGVRTADCVPILLADTRRRAVAAVHAGWRGTAAAIAAKVVLELRERFNSAPGEIVAAIGPAIGECCYRVGPEVAGRFREWFPERCDLDGPARIDLAEANRRQLIRAGLHESKVCVAGLCSYCSGGEFQSWRRQREAAGRLISAIWILKKH
ncbi:MAG: peptidoglycan editing factor PgeF [Bryobacterales bacterium]|nr:peptidoglycan editing factor PgeF [Bryobacterales bacterium]